MYYSISSQIIARAFLWVLLLSTDILAPVIFTFAPQNLWVYIVVLLVMLAIFGTTLFLGRDSLANDVREICLYDVFMASIGVILFLHGTQAAAPVHAMMDCVFLLKYGRLMWPCRTSDGQHFVTWPTFGVLGWLARLRGTPAEPLTCPSRRQACYAYAYMALCVVAGIAIQYFGFKFTLAIFCLFPLVAIPICYRRVLDFLQAQFDAHAAAIEDAARKKQQAIDAQEMAAVQSRMNEVLLLSNRELAQAKEALEQANAAKQKVLDELALMNDALRDAAHDLQAPLGAIGLRAHRLLQATLPQERQTAASLLEDTISYMGRAIYDTVHEAKIVTGVAQPSIIAVELDDLIADLIEELDDIAYMYKMADMATFPLDDTGLIIATDIRLLRRILYNLMHNAIAHSQPGTSVLLSVRARHGGVLAQVWDDGPGIAGMQGKDAAANFRALVERMRGPLKSRTSGHGLGLNNVLQLTKALGLTITVRSRVGRGTVFSVLFPLAEPALIAASLRQDGLDVDADLI